MVNEKSKLYDESSIESLSPLEFTRLRPQVYCGSTANPNQLLVEIISNSIDEFNAGHGSKIEVTISKDVLSVRDYGQGFLVNSKREDGKTILEAAFSVLNTSGKYREDGTYEGTSLGSFGIGSKLATFLSHWLLVKTWRDRKSEEILFKEGVFETRNVENSKEPSGTYVQWQPSEEFFDTNLVDIPLIKSLFKTLVCLCPGLKILLNENGKEETFYSENGLSDYVDSAVKDKEIIDHRFSLKWAEEKNKIDLVMTYTSNYSLTLIPYVNTGLTDTGFHITQIKALITREVNKFAKEKKWLKETDTNLTGDDIQEGMYLVFNITAPGVAYDAQVKSRITKIEMKPFIQPFTEAFNFWLGQNEKDIKIIVDKALQARKAREAAKKAKEAVRNVEKKKEKALKFDSKLADCYSKDRSKCELMIVEGDSAAGNLKTARNNEFTAIMPIRGKLLNVRKATLDKIQKNAEIMTIIDAIGLKVDKKTMKLTYDEKDLRYGKIIIESDADVDGAHIKNLFYTFMWTFCPKLISDGHVYAGVPPLYKVTLGKDEYHYLKDDAALEKFKLAHPGRSLTVNRLKGLGELSAGETEILVDPDMRIIKQITVEDAKKADKLFDDLMGEAITPRKTFIKEHSSEAKYE